MEWASAAHWMGTRVLVTGAAGLLGRAVCHRLLEAGAEVHGLRRTRALGPGIIEHVGSLPADTEEVFGRSRPQVVFHLACPIRLERDPVWIERLWPGIVGSTVAVARSCREQGARLVHVGSCAEYGAGPPPLSEASPLVPATPYAVLKAAATHWVLGQCGQGLRGGVVRPFRIYGPWGRQGLVWEACRAALSGEPLELTDGEQVLEWNHVESIAGGVVAAGAHPAALGQVLNLGGGPRVSVLELVRQVFATAGADETLIRVGSRARRAGDFDAFWGDHTRSESLWGSLEGMGLDEGLTDTLEWKRRDCTD